MEKINNLLIAFGDKAWGYPLLILLIGGGLYFTLFTGFRLFAFLPHSINILRGKYDKHNTDGDISHFEALSTALAATVGMGNISGVAVAITMGGPGALFWMWVSALVGVSTKFFTCTLSIMYRGKDDRGETQGGPMYFIVEGLGKNWKPLAVLFAIAGMFGPLPVFNVNQLVQTINDVVMEPSGIEVGTKTNFIIGVLLSLIVGVVVIGGIKRIGKVTAKLVPLMVVIYVATVLYIIFSNFGKVDDCFALIFEDAFSGNAVMGGALGAIIIAGVRRAAFSNEAGIGTAPMAHGAAKTDEPVREGLIAMLGPIIDTLVVCTMTALAIIITDTWQNPSDQGISITLAAFNKALPSVGSLLLMICVIFFSMSSMFSQSYYSAKCFSFLFGTKYKNYFNVFYVLSIIAGAVASLKAVVGLIDGLFAIMAIPTMIGAISLSPKVWKEAKSYFRRLKEGAFD